MTERSGSPQYKWASGSAYELYVGRWSRVVAREFVAWVALPAAGRWLDVGCGTGALTQTILEHAAPRSIVAMDRSQAFATHALEHTSDPRARFLVGDARNIGLESRCCDAAVSGLVLNFVPQPELAVAEMRRIVAPGGTMAVYVWDYADKMEMQRYFWNAAADLDPAVKDIDEALRFALCRPEPLAQLLRTNGMEGVEVRAIDVPMVFKDFDDYWLPFLGGQGPAPGYAMSLSEDRRAVLRERIRAELPAAADGSIPLAARVWAARGFVRSGAGR